MKKLITKLLKRLGFAVLAEIEQETREREKILISALAEGFTDAIEACHRKFHVWKPTHKQLTENGFSKVFTENLDENLYVLRRNLRTIFYDANTNTFDVHSIMGKPNRILQINSITDLRNISEGKISTTCTIRK